MTIKDFNIGDKVYVLDFGYRSNFENAVLKEATVTDIGRKLITVDFHCGTKFKVFNEKDLYLVENVTAGTPNWLFKSVQDYEDYKEYTDLLSQCRKVFQDYSKVFTLEQIRAIKEILDR